MKETAQTPASAAASSKATCRFSAVRWYLLQVAIIVAADILLGRTHYFDGHWYDRAELEAKDHRIDYIFIGPSRVAAAIHVPTFDTFISKQLGRPVRSLNLGMGYSTLVEHRLVLRRLYRVAPQNLEGCTVFYEAPGQYLDDEGLRMWVHGHAPELLAPLLEFSDLPELWRSPANFDEKFSATAEVILRPSALFSRRRKIFQAVFVACDSGFTKLTGLFQTEVNTAETTVTSDLVMEGGIQIGGPDVEKTKRVVLAAAEHSIKNEHLHRDWDSRSYRDLRDLIEQYRGKIVLYEMPLHSRVRRMYETDIGRKNVHLFQQKLEGLRTVMLTPSFVTRDEDFPDVAHLSSAKARGFTTSLAMAYLDYLAEQR